jgi:hypothetical protein
MREKNQSKLDAVIERRAFLSLSGTVLDVLYAANLAIYLIGCALSVAKGSLLKNTTQ